MTSFEARMLKIENSVSRSLKSLARVMANNPPSNMWNLKQHHDTLVDSLCRDLLSTPSVIDNPDCELYAYLISVVESIGCDMYAQEEDIVSGTQAGWELVRIFSDPAVIGVYTLQGRHKQRMQAVFVTIETMKCWLFVTETIMDAMHSSDVARTLGCLISDPGGKGR